MTVLLAFGCRPEEIKIRPLINHWLSIGFKDFEIYLSGQHQELCDKWNKEYSAKGISVNQIHIKQTYTRNRLNNILGFVIDEVSYILAYKKYECVVVQGDTSTALGSALAAFNSGVKVAHIEAGLRSFDLQNPFPEEANRRMISSIASINFCPTHENTINLKREQVNGEIYEVGNTIIDLFKSQNITPTITNKIICTFHRRETLNDLAKWFGVLEETAEIYTDYDFILVLHKNPDVYKYKGTFKYVKDIEPMEYEEFIRLSASALAICSQSGGNIEEAVASRKPIFLCREATERPEAEDFYLWCKTPEQLRFNFWNFFNNKDYYLDQVNALDCVFGDGNACRHITNILKDKGIITLP